MADIITTINENPAYSKLVNECEFTIERIDGVGGMIGTRRVSFKGFATDELRGALIDAIGCVLSDKQGEVA